MILGCDTSHWSGEIDFAIMAARGIRFDIAKMTDFRKLSSIGFVDSNWDKTYLGCRDNDILTGGYHWLQPGADPTVQARFYLDQYFKTPTDFPPVLDFEDASFTSASDYAWRAQKWLQVVENETGRVPIVYTGKWFMAKFPKDKVSFLVKYPLWIAQYTVLQLPPSVPYPWDKWSIWQYSATGDGLYYGTSSKAIDLNYCDADYFKHISTVAKPQRKYCQYPSGDRLKQVQ